MNSKQRRTKRRKEQHNNSIDAQIIRESKEQGLERVMWDEMQNLSEEYFLSQNSLMCGYIGQPIYVNKTHTRITRVCVLDGKKCEYEIPQHNHFTYDCPKYKRLVENEK